MDAAGWAGDQAAAVRDDPAGRLALLDRTYRIPGGDAARRLPYRRAALSFMRWQLRRGLLAPAHAPRPGSPWWRAVNEALLRDGCEAAALLEGRPGSPSSGSVAQWMAFAERPSAGAWYRAHNASVVRAYLGAQRLARAENRAERFFMNVILARVLFAHALVAAPRLSLGWAHRLAPPLGDPRLGMPGIFVQLARVLPDSYPLVDDVGRYQDAELGFGKLVDYGVIVPRVQAVYEWSAAELDEPELLRYVDAGTPAYEWPAADAGRWHPPPTRAVRAVRRLLPG